MQEQVQTKSIEQKTLEILKQYKGSNNYILKLKQQQEVNPKFIPTRAQCDYINGFYNVEPKVAKKWVEIDSYFAKKLVDDNPFIKEPDKIYVEKLLVEKDKSYHIWGKVFSGDSLYDFWIPKTAIHKAKTRNVNVDWDKYNHRPPLSHQKECIIKLLENDKFIVADDMGLGKTTSTIIATLETEAKKVLIICPASLKINWKREIALYTEGSCYIVEGKKWEEGHKYYIINYDIMKNFHEPKSKDSILLRENFDLVVIDEAHYISNPQAQRTKIINDVVKNIERLWLLTGTPMTSRPMNYYNLLNLVESSVAEIGRAHV